MEDYSSGRVYQWQLSGNFNQTNPRWKGRKIRRNEKTWTNFGFTSAESDSTDDSLSNPTVGSSFLGKEQRANRKGRGNVAEEGAANIKEPEKLQGPRQT